MPASWMYPTRGITSSRCALLSSRVVFSVTWCRPSIRWRDCFTVYEAEHFAFVEVCELLLRYYKPEPTRLRPTDRMVAHTGFLTFGRRIEPSEDERAKELLEEAGGAAEEEKVDPESEVESPD